MFQFLGKLRKSKKGRERRVGLALHFDMKSIVFQNIHDWYVHCFGLIYPLLTATQWLDAYAEEHQIIIFANILRILHVIFNKIKVTKEHDQTGD